MRKGKKYKRKNFKRRRRIQLYTRIGACIMLMLAVSMGIMKVFEIGLFKDQNQYVEENNDDIDKMRPVMDVKLLTPNPYSRPGIKTNRIRGIVIHYTANPGSTAMQNRDYFEGLKDNHKTKVSSHFVIGPQGEIVQCVPTWEVAYASNSRNSDTVSIETCHLTEDGTYTKETYQSLVELTAWLCKKFDLTEKDVIRHYDVTGKICPKYFVEDEKAWEKFRNAVKNSLESSF